jgi:hypothetical protein
MSLTRWSMCCAVLGALICGWQAVVSGFSLDWDLLNYHLYNPWAWLQGRALDIAPGQLQTYFNPLLHLPYLLGFLYLPQHWLLFLTGAVQGLQLGLLYALAWQVLPPSARRPWVCLPLAVLGLAGPIFRAELGVSQGDTLLSLPLLVVLLLLLPTLRAGGASWRAVLCAGLLAGITVALKLTMAVYVAGLGVALLLAASSGQQLRLATVFGLGATAGLLLAGEEIITFSAERANILKLNHEEIVVLDQIYGWHEKDLLTIAERLVQETQLIYCLVTLSDKGVLAVAESGEDV